MENLNAFVVRHTDGSADVESTVDKFRGVLLTYLAKRETEDTEIAAAVNAVFDQYKGTSVNMPALCSLSIAKMNGVEPSNWDAMKERVASFVRENGSIYEIKKGKGGGVKRLVDHPATETPA